MTPGSTPVPDQDVKKTRQGPGPHSLNKNLANTQGLDSLMQPVDPATLETQELESLQAEVCRSLASAFDEEAHWLHIHTLMFKVIVEAYVERPLQGDSYRGQRPSNRVWHLDSRTSVSA